MEKDEQLLKIVTNETKSSIESLEIVTPTLFESIFNQFAKRHNLFINDEYALTYNILKAECSMLTDLQTKTSQNVSLLSDSTSKAIHAIHENNQDVLQEVLLETQKLKEEIEKLKKSVYLDTLTRAYNRKWLQDNYTKEETFASKTSGVLALIDLNYFKVINDTYGHVIGDKVLIFLASEFLKLGFPLVRYGGDEFLIMFDSQTTPKKAEEMLTNLREQILKKKFKSAQKTFTVSFSFGVTPFAQDDSCVSVLELADQAMYEDKQKIKKRIQSI